MINKLINKREREIIIEVCLSTHKYDTLPFAGFRFSDM